MTQKTKSGKGAEDFLAQLANRNKSGTDKGGTAKSADKSAEKEKKAKVTVEDLSEDKINPPDRADAEPPPPPPARKVAGQGYVQATWQPDIWEWVFPDDAKEEKPAKAAKSSNGSSKSSAADLLAKGKRAAEKPPAEPELESEDEAEAARSEPDNIPELRALVREEVLSVFRELLQKLAKAL